VVVKERRKEEGAAERVSGRIAANLRGSIFKIGSVSFIVPVELPIRTIQIMDEVLLCFDAGL